MNRLSQNLVSWPSVSQRIVARTFRVIVPLGTLVAACLGKIEFGGKYVSGYVWVAQAPIAVAALLICGSGWSRFPLWLWAPWLGWLVCRCDWTNFSAVQDTVMLMLPPIFAAAAANAIATKDALRRLTWCFTPIALITGVVAIANRMEMLPFGPLVREGGTWTTLCLCACYFAVYAYSNRWKGILMWLYCVLCCAVMGARMATAVSILVLPLCPLPYKTRTRVFYISGCLLLVAGLLLLPSMQRKMFYSGEFRVTKTFDEIENLRTSGRDYIWSELWSEAWQKPLFGAGADAADRVVWFDKQQEWKQPHNDYLKVFFNYGIIGVVLLGVPVVYTILDSLRRLRMARHATLRNAWASSFLGMCAICLLCTTGNTLVYISYFGLYLFSIIGGAYRLAGANDETTTRRGRTITTTPPRAFGISRKRLGVSKCTRYY